LMGAAFGSCCAGTGAAVAASSVVASNQLFKKRLDIDILPILDLCDHLRHFGGRAFDTC
jgi:hypothetical protein